MTNEEFSDGFDVLINSYSSIESFGVSLNPLNFDEYEKSIFLTEAQEAIVEGLYTGKILGESFEGTELLRRALAPLVKTVSLSLGGSSTGISSMSEFVTLPEDVWFITYESATLDGNSTCTDGKEVQVVPVTQDEYHRIKDNPFKQPNLRRVIRLDINNSMIELISLEHIRSYLVRYLSRPEPIILVDLPDNLTINNTKEKTECKLNSSLHRMILEMAVNMAIKSRVASLGK